MEQIQKAKISLVLKQPTYAAILMDLDTVYDPTDLPPGLPETVLTDSKKLYVYRKFVSTLTQADVERVLKHEALHIMLMHCAASRFPAGQYKRSILMLAVDHAVNNIILEEDGRPDNLNWVCDVKYKGWSVEQIYRDLQDNQDEDEDSEQSEGGEGDGTPNLQPADAIPNSDPDAEVQAQERVSKAMAIGKAMGKEVGGTLRRMLDEMLTPKANWKEELSDWCKNASQDDYSFARVNRRFVWQGLRMPAKYNPTGSMRALAVVLDSSGSVSEAEALRYLSETAAAANECAPTDLFVSICTTQVVNEFHLTPPFDFTELRGAFVSGGTDMTAGLEWAAQLPVEVDGVIVLTDGYTPFGNEPDIPVLWAMTSNKKAPYGRTLYVGD